MSSKYVSLLLGERSSQSAKGTIPHPGIQPTADAILRTAQPALAYRADRPKGLAGIEVGGKWQSYQIPTGDAMCEEASRRIYLAQDGCAIHGVLWMCRRAPAAWP
jgi:hypothetical protein